MSTFDIRNVELQQIDRIKFADRESASKERQACELFIGTMGESIIISDTVYHLQVNGKGHAHNLIKSLNKAIELGWLK